MRTITDLQTHLDVEMAWRVREISELKTSIGIASGLKQTTLLRAGVPLLYAHWEGFIKDAAESLVKYVSFRRMNYGELNNNYIAIGIKAKLNAISDSNKISANQEIVEFIIKEMNNRARFPVGDVVTTESNLGSNALREILLTLGISQEKYQTSYIYLDESLVDKRNAIAHGKYLDVDHDSFKQLSAKVVTLMRAFKDDVLNYATQAQFLRVPPISVV